MMVKYRSLTTEELKSLEKEFIQYLIVNGIAAEDWEKLKEASPEKAERVVDLFSDVIFEDVLRRVQFLEQRTKSHVLCYHFLPEKILLFGIKGDSSADFTNRDFLKKSINTPPSGMELIRSEKVYTQSREEELFQLLNNGHEATDGTLFKALAIAMADQEGQAYSSSR